VHPRVVHHRHGGPTATTTTLDDARGGGENERRREATRGDEDRLDRIRASVRASARIESNASNESIESIESIGRTVDDRSIESISFIRAFIPIHPSLESDEERRRREARRPTGVTTRGASDEGGRRG